MEIYNYIYLTINIKNGKQYIGKHKGQLYDDYIGSGSIIKQAINKYGRENFKKYILELIINDSDVDEAEIYWINKFNAVKSSKFYNITRGGTGGNTLENLTATILNNRYLKYKDWCNNLSEKEIDRISKVRSKNMVNARKDKDLEISRIKNFKKTMKNKSKEWKRERYKNQSGKYHYCAKKIHTPSGIFETAKDASAHYKVCTQTILNRCKNKKFKDWWIINKIKTNREV